VSAPSAIVKVLKELEALSNRIASLERIVHAQDDVFSSVSNDSLLGDEHKAGGKRERSLRRFFRFRAKSRVEV